MPRSKQAIYFLFFLQIWPNQYLVAHAGVTVAHIFPSCDKWITRQIGPKSTSFIWRLNQGKLQLKIHKIPKTWCIRSSRGN